MTDLENNLEEVWNQEYRDFMLSFYPESSPLVSTWEIYRMAKIKSQKEIKNLLVLTETLNQIRDNLQDENRKLEQGLQKTGERHEKCMISFGIKLTEVQDKHDELLSELQKTREQLAESNELLIDVKDIFQDKIFLLNINDSCFSRLRRWNNDSQKYIDKYFKDKDKQGE